MAMALASAPQPQIASTPKAPQTPNRSQAKPASGGPAKEPMRSAKEKRPE